MASAHPHLDHLIPRSIDDKDILMHKASTLRNLLIQEEEKLQKANASRQWLRDRLDSYSFASWLRMYDEINRLKKEQENFAARNEELEEDAKNLKKELADCYEKINRKQRKLDEVKFTEDVPATPSPIHPITTITGTPIVKYEEDLTPLRVPIIKLRKKTRSGRGY